MPLDSTTYRPGLSTLEILRHARNGIATPGRWVSGKMVSGNAFCAAGWLRDATRDHGQLDLCALILLQTAMEPPFPHCAPFADLVEYNDTHTQAEVVALFDRAIELVAAQN